MTELLKNKGCVANGTVSEREEDGEERFSYFLMSFNETSAFSWSNLNFSSQRQIFLTTPLLHVPDGSPCSEQLPPDTDHSNIVHVESKLFIGGQTRSSAEFKGAGSKPAGKAVLSAYGGPFGEHCRWGYDCRCFCSCYLLYIIHGFL